MQEYTK